MSEKSASLRPNALRSTAYARGDPDRGAHAAEARRGELEPTDVEDVERHAVALALLAEQVVRRNHYAVEGQRAGRGAVEAHLRFLGPHREPRRAALDQEGAELLAVDLGVDREQVGEAGVGDELLRPVEAPRSIGLAGRAGADAHRIRPGRGLGERVGADGGPGRQPGQVSALLRVRPEEHGRQRADPRVGGVGHGERSCRRHRLVDDERRDAVQAGPAVFLRDVDPEEPVAPQALQELAVGRVVASLDGIPPRIDLSFDEGLHRVPDRAVLVAQALRREDALGTAAGRSGTRLPSRCRCARVSRWS